MQGLHPAPHEQLTAASQTAPAQSSAATVQHQGSFGKAGVQPLHGAAHSPCMHHQPCPLHWAQTLALCNTRAALHSQECQLVMQPRVQL